MVMTMMDRRGMDGLTAPLQLREAAGAALHVAVVGLRVRGFFMIRGALVGCIC